jgi:hypothetical protein
MTENTTTRDNNTYNIRHNDFVAQIQLKEFLQSKKDITQLRDMTDRLEAIFGNDEKDYPHVQK